MRSGERSRRALLALVAATGLLVGACGGSDTDESDAGTPEVPADAAAEPADVEIGDSLEDQVAP